MCRKLLHMKRSKAFKALESGPHISNKKRRKINGDVTKLAFAENVSPDAKRLAADVRYRTFIVL